MTNQTETNTENDYYNFTDDDGREWLMRPVPKHFYLMFGQLPSAISDRAMLAIKNKDEEAFENEMVSKLSAQELFNSMMFTREAVKYACVKPRIAFNPQTEEEISPFDISEKAFKSLAACVMKELGGQTEGLNSFRRQPEQPAGNRADKPKLRKTSKRNSRLPK